MPKETVQSQQSTNADSTNQVSVVKDTIITLKRISMSIEDIFVKIIGEKAKGIVSQPQIKDDYIVVSLTLDITNETINIKPDLLVEISKILEIQGVIWKFAIGEWKLTVAVRTI